VKSRAKPTNRAGRRSLITNPYEVLIQGVVDYAIYMLDLDGRVVSWNPGAERIKGYTEDEILGEHFSRFYTPEDRAAGAPEQALRMAVESGRFTAEAWRCRKDGSRFWAMVVIDPIYQDDTLIGFAKITRDLTERLEAQQQLEHSRELLFQSQKMEAVGQLTGGLAHDFNNLLTGIAGNLELMKRRIAQGRFADIDRFMTGAQDAASRAAALTHRLLAFARRQTLDPKLINPSLLIANLRDLLQRTIGPTIELETVGVTDLGSALCDPHQLENAILNLCINARDAMPDGGRITLETAGATLNDHDARARDMDPGQYIVIGVTDTGTGIPSDVLAHVFEPFFTTKPAGQGTGLGLSMIYGFAKQSGGQVLIDSREGGGTTVRIYLPQHSGNTDAEAQPDRLAEVPQARSDETILIVDDEPTVRTVITEVLSELGYAAIEVSDGASGLKVLQSDVRIDLLITDVGLSGGLNGRQMADAARLSRPKLPVLFITGYAESVAIGTGALAPGMHLMAKPFAMEALASRIKSIIRDGC
jgi:PAS domain S-box-containing protein